MLVGCSSSETKESTNKTIKVGMVADMGGINDESFNQSAWEGLQQAEKDLFNASEAISKKYKFKTEDTIAMQIDFCAKSIAIVSKFFTDKVKDRHAMIDELIDEVRKDVYEYMEEL